MTAAMKRCVLAAAMSVALLEAGRAGPVSLFGPSAGERAGNYLRRTDAVLSRADAAYEGGNLDQALILYERAHKGYATLHRDHPDLHDGLPR
ncbi:MAG: hypothetical protein PHR35_02080, partial [Kiritimatiellae bacterium]|nr:hypothetical protein [Kiritimatiellia bacterium]